MNDTHEAQVVEKTKRSPWLWVIVAGLVLALVSLLSNVTTTAQLSGEANGLLAVRQVFSKLANSGTAWAGVAVLAGWLVRRPLQAAAAGIVATAVAIVAHYGLGMLVGMFGTDVWSDNRIWVIAPFIVGIPLGLIGAAARRPGALGFLAALVVPAGAVLEPFVLDMLTPASLLPWPQRVASTVCGVVLIVFGVTLGTRIVRRRRSHPSQQPARVEA